MAPVRLAEDARSGRYLSLLERRRIADLRGQGLGVREIARRLGRAPSTISRELDRNTLAHDRGYDGELAHARARERARRPRRCLILADSGLRAEIQAKLELEWSPQQIAAYLRFTFPDRPRWHVCHETIYQGVYHPGRGGLSRELTKKLRTGRSLRRRRRRADARVARFNAPLVPIARRPAVIEQRVRVGDWEGDLITGRFNRSAIGTLVDRTSRYVKLIPLVEGRGAEQVRDALFAVFARLPVELRRSLTWDQGSEMALHDQIAPLFADGLYFAQPASPWQRGTNENTNGLLRQYFPKGTDLSVHTPDEIRAVEDRLNNRPRKVLEWRTPAEVFESCMRP